MMMMNAMIIMVKQSLLLSAGEAVPGLEAASDTSHGHKEPCEASRERGQGALTSADQDLYSSQDTQVT